MLVRLSTFLAVSIAAVNVAGFVPSTIAAVLWFNPPTKSMIFIFIGNGVAFSSLWSAFVNLITYSPMVSPVLCTQFLYSNCHRFISAVVVNFVKKSCLNAVSGVNMLLQAAIIPLTLLYHWTAGSSSKLAAIWVFLASPHLFAKATLLNCSIHSVGSSLSYPENLPQEAMLYSL